MAPPDTIWHKESLKLKEIFGTREGFEICPYQLFPGPIKAPGGGPSNTISTRHEGFPIDQPALKNREHAHTTRKRRRARTQQASAEPTVPNPVHYGRYKFGIPLNFFPKSLSNGTQCNQLGSEPASMHTI